MDEYDSMFRLFGVLVNRLRIEKGFSQEYLAELIDLHRNSIVAIERGEFDISNLTITNISLVLGVEGYLFDFKNGLFYCTGFGDSVKALQLDEYSLINRDLGLIMEFLRMKHGISRETLSDQIGIHRNTIARLESGVNNFRASTLFRLCEYYGISEIGRLMPGKIVPSNCSINGFSMMCPDANRKYDILLDE